MADYVKINLAALPSHVVKTLKGKGGEEIECVIIPIKKNNIFKSEKGNLYLDLVMFPLAQPKDNQTHLVKQSLSKEVREKMTDKEKKEQPILGSANIWNGSFSEKAPEEDSDLSDSTPSEDDLPF